MAINELITIMRVPNPICLHSCAPSTSESNLLVLASSTHAHLVLCTKQQSILSLSLSLVDSPSLVCSFVHITELSNNSRSTKRRFFEL